MAAALNPAPLLPVPLLVLAAASSAIVPHPLATGWGRWAESHRRSIYGPIGDGRGQRHLPASSLDPGCPSYTSGVTPTAVGPPGSERDGAVRGEWAVKARQHQKTWGAHAFGKATAPYPTALIEREEARFFATREGEDATAGGYAGTSLGPEAVVVRSLSRPSTTEAFSNYLRSATYCRNVDGKRGSSMGSYGSGGSGSSGGSGGSGSPYNAAPQPTASQCGDSSYSPAGPARHHIDHAHASKSTRTKREGMVRLAKGSGGHGVG
eukprot:CAMPEP_0174696906 /NCGR_PEP_ID=MMETSP1094-20130205/2922_1 /TAXON_ID=156173 /ORGANISM="Chrysochromulina brevifilum, Strain UTEX LB 985" /LENGTH=264 /DNA_ID=CAMNT_0015893777 /DNA_START=28 /DNA_END=823 /DNA_ORIENTATION=-